MLPLLLTLSLCPQSAGDVAEPLAEPTPLTVNRGGFAVAEERGRTLAIGPGWKAFFDAGRVEFHTALGERAPRNLPLSLELESVRRGGVEWDDFGRPAPARSTSRVRFQRAHGILERYEVSADGIELCLDFPTEPGTSGDLVVRYDVASELVAEALGEQPDLRLRSEHGGVSIGTVTGIDANGMEAAGRLRFDGEHLDLILPAAFVDVAAWPLTLDPLIGPEFEATVPGEVGTSPAIGFEATSNDYLVAWVVPFSISDQDVRARRVDQFTNLLGASLLPIESQTGTFALTPTIASSRSANKWLVAWAERASLFAPGRVRMRAVNPVGNVLSSVVETFDIGAGQSSPSLCSDPTLIDDDVLLVWNNDGVDIRVAQVQLGAAEPLLFGERIIVQNPDAANAQISRSLGDGHRALVVWSQDVAEDGGKGDVFAVGFDGQTLNQTSVLRLTNTAEHNDAFPKCDGDGRIWRVVYETDFLDDNPIQTRRVRRQDVELLADGTLEASNLAGVPAAGGNYRPTIVHTGAAIAIAMADIGPSNDLTCEVRLNGGLNPGGAITGNFQEPLSTVLVPTAIGAVDDGIVSNSPDVRVAWRAATGGIRLGIVDATANIQVVTPACGSTGVARASLPYGSYQLNLDVTGAPPLLPAFCALGFQRADAVCGACLLVPDLAAPGVFQLRTTDVDGRAFIQLEVPNDPALIGFEAFNQWFTVSANPQCPTFGIDTTRALKLTVF